MSRPPEGAIRGETVPSGSEPDERTRVLIEHMENWLKTKTGGMSDAERREAAKDRLRAMGVSV
jgi:hypothetical protein